MSLTCIPHPRTRTRTRKLDLRLRLSAQIPLSRALEAFELAGDRRRSTEAQVVCD